MRQKGGHSTHKAAIPGMQGSPRLSLARGAGASPRARRLFRPQASAPTQEGREGKAVGDWATHVENSRRRTLSHLGGGNRTFKIRVV